MRRYWAMVVAALVVGLVPSAALATPPATPAFRSAPVDPHRAGAEGFRSMVLAAYPASWSGELWAPCNSPNHISTSSHHAGRAWDWFITAMGNRSEGAERAMADELLAWLLEPVD